jgi:signal peptidase II
LPGKRRTKKEESLGRFVFTAMITLFFTAAALFLIDQISKFLIQKFISLEQSIPIIQGIFHITIVHNKGAAFGLFKEQTIALIIISIAAVVLFPLFYKSSVKHSRLAAISLGMIAGGACGNLVDRLRFGYVVDFLDFRVWPVFNIADAAITIGAVMLAICLIKRKR